MLSEEEVLHKNQKKEEEKPLAPQQLALCRYEAEKILGRRILDGLGSL